MSQMLGFGYQTPVLTVGHFLPPSTPILCKKNPHVFGISSSMGSSYPALSPSPQSSDTPQHTDSSSSQTASHFPDHSHTENWRCRSQEPESPSQTRISQGFSLGRSKATQGRDTYLLKVFWVAFWGIWDISDCMSHLRFDIFQFCRLRLRCEDKHRKGCNGCGLWCENSLWYRSW